MLFLIWCATVFVALVVYFRQVYSRFSRYGVKHFTPLPLLGNFGTVLLRLNHISEEVDKLCYRFPGERFVGRYDLNVPLIYIRDLELVKKIAVKDFEYFLDHRSFVDKEADPLFGRNLFSLQGEEWKDMRSTLSPAFTSSKIRLMVPFMVEIGDQMVMALRNKIKDSGDGYIDVDAKDLTTRYANDVIASCAFGLKVDSHTDKQNDFYSNSKEATNIKFKQGLMLFAYLSFPSIMSKWKVTLFSKSVTHFFRSLVMSTMQDREERYVIRPDMIHLLMEAKKGKLTHGDKTANDADAGFSTVEESSVGKKDISRVWSDDDLVAQAVLFLFAGFETVSSAMSFLLHELAVNPDVQEKLVQEIRENDVKNGGKFDYNSIQNMTYLDMVISELLRIWPPVVSLDRICTKDYNLGRASDKATKDYIIRKGEGLAIPAWVFHRDAEYFPDPLRFDPERFSEQNKHNIKPFSYMPFGLGPRNCIGSRFALCEVKVMAYQLLQQLKVSPATKTQIPAKLAPDTFNLKINGGHWVRFQIRN